MTDTIQLRALRQRLAQDSLWAPASRLNLCELIDTMLAHDPAPETLEGLRERARRTFSPLSVRRSHVDFYCYAETAIRNAIIAVEAMPADPRLTDAVVLLGQAKDKVADFIDADPQQQPPLPPAAP